MGKNLFEELGRRVLLTWFQIYPVGFIPIKMQGSGNQPNYFLEVQYSELANVLREKHYLGLSGFCDGGEKKNQQK